jgi:hypothetical protein
MTLPETDRIIDVPLPQTLEDALKVAKSLVCWIEFIQTKGSMSSNGGHVEFHLAALNAWFQLEKIKALGDLS